MGRPNPDDAVASDQQSQEWLNARITAKIWTPPKNIAR